jgi:hypothetical protein
MYRIGARWITYEEFLKFTPAAYAVFVEEKLESEKREIELNNNYFGTVCAVLTSLFSKRSRKPSDFFKLKKPEQPATQTAEQMSDFLKSLTGRLGGSVNG